MKKCSKEGSKRAYATAPVNYFGHWLKDELNHKQMSQKALADKAGLTEARVAQIMRGSGRPSIPSLVLICDILEVKDFEEPLRLIYMDEMSRAFKKIS